MANLLFGDSIAAAVAREIERGHAEGLAYKAEFVRQLEQHHPSASEALGDELSLQLCDDAARDAQLMNELTARNC